MKLIYTHENKIIVENAKAFLEQVDIQCVLRNEFASGGMGELSPIETWPELWVDDDVYVKAKKRIDILLDKNDGPTWQCLKCDEVNEASFELCWKCSSEKSFYR